MAADRELALKLPSPLVYAAVIEWLDVLSVLEISEEARHVGG